MGGKLPTGLEVLRSVSQTRPVCQLRINLYTCKSNEKQLYFRKSLFFTRGTCVQFANKVCALLIEIHQVEMQI